ncbi:MAG: FecR domain-containing protein [Saprospiraceae bacterium]|nr:FecR domain-containing protein [Saprospiraceae bacterium]
MKDYQYYTVNDFIDDVGFRNYVLRKNATDIAFWAQWIAENAHKKELIAEAEKLVLLFAAQTPPSVSNTETSEEWQKLWSRIETQQKEIEVEQPVLEPVLEPIEGGKNKWLWVAAASVALLATAAFLFFKKNPSSLPWESFGQYQSISEAKTDTFKVGKEKTATTIDFSGNTETSIKTPFGKTQQVTLPDGSTVLLNANSQLRFSKNWSKTEARMVWLNGEAEFSVKHYDVMQGSAQKFIVHTEGVKVEVIGTRFNLMSRGEKCKLALYEGKVELQLTKHPEQENIAITPNEVVQVDNGAVVRIIPIKKVEVYQAWTKQHFEFDDTPLSEVALLVENNYGVKFVFKEEALKNKRLTASIPDDDVAVLVKVICQIFNINNKQKAKEIIFETKN